MGEGKEGGGGRQGRNIASGGVLEGMGACPTRAPMCPPLPIAPFVGGKVLLEGLKPLWGKGLRAFWGIFLAPCNYRCKIAHFERKSQ